MRISEWSSDVCSSDLTTAQLAQVISEVEGRGHDCRTALVPSGKHAIIAVFLSFLSSGDHVLISDSVYGPARIFAEEELTRFGIEVEFFDPLIDADGLSERFRSSTRMIYLESPGTMTFDVIDVRSEEHTSELQSLMRISYAVFCLKK